MPRSLKSSLARLDKQIRVFEFWPGYLHAGSVYIAHKFVVCHSKRHVAAFNDRKAAQQFRHWYLKREKARRVWQETVRI